MKNNRSMQEIKEEKEFDRQSFQYRKSFERQPKQLMKDN